MIFLSYYKRNVRRNSEWPNLKEYENSFLSGREASHSFNGFTTKAKNTNLVSFPLFGSNTDQKKKKIPIVSLSYRWREALEAYLKMLCLFSCRWSFTKGITKNNLGNLEVVRTRTYQGNFRSRKKLLLSISSNPNLNITLPNSTLLLILVITSLVNGLGRKRLNDKFTASLKEYARICGTLHRPFFTLESSLPMDLLLLLAPPIVLNQCCCHKKIPDSCPCGQQTLVFLEVVLMLTLTTEFEKLWLRERTLQKRQCS